MKISQIILSLSIALVLILITGCLPTMGPPSTEDILANPDQAIANCEQAPEGDREGCYWDISSSLTEAELFDKVLEVCDIMESDDCYWDLAMDAELIDACKLISDSNRKKDCLFDLARENNMEACKELTKQFDRDDCLFNIARQTESLEACGEIIDSSTKDNCYGEMAERFMSTDLGKAFEACEKRTRKDGCYWDLMHNLKTTKPDVALSACSKLSVDVDDCYFDVSRSLYTIDLNKAIYICGTMEYTSNKNNCYNEIAGKPAITLANPDKAIEVCGKMTTDMNGCYENVARILTDSDKDKAKEACGYITDSGWEDGCEKSYG